MTPHDIAAAPLAAESFAPFGVVTESPAPGARHYLDAALANLRPVAGRAGLSIAHVAPSLARPLPLTIIERHRYSSQSFVPLDPGRYLVVVAPKREDGAADLSRCLAFVAGNGQSFTYHADVWHGPITPLDLSMRFAIMMFNDGTALDEEVIRRADAFARVVL